jgi:two-component system, sensor histidine kinase FlrB
MDREETRMNTSELGMTLLKEDFYEDSQTPNPEFEEDTKFNALGLKDDLDILNNVSAKLDKSHEELEAQVAELNKELVISYEQGNRRAQESATKDHKIDRLTALVSVLPSGVVILDKNSVVRDINPKAVELLGEPLTGLSWSGVVARVAIPEVRSGFELRLRDGRILSLVSRDLGSQGERVILITEVTSIHENQERANRDKRLAALGEMAASLAHQIRTPLSSSMLYMSQLSLSKLPQEVRASMADKVQDRLSHMSSLIDSMLSFVRGAKPQTRAISLASLIEKTEQLTKLTAAQSGASVKFSEVDPGLMIHGDLEVLAGAVVNLVLNAIQMNPENPWVSVLVESISNTQVQIKVSDNGPGIPASHIEKIFDPFFTTRMQGTGLGLAVVAMTVSAHDGDISVQNRDTGGAEFTIRLPLLNTVAAIGKPPYRAYNVSREVA